MSIKSKLFAGVAAPLMSLPLIMQPATAAPPKVSLEAGTAGDVVRVQEQLIVPPGAAPQEEQQQEEAPAEEAPAEQAPEPAPEAQQEAPAEVQPEAPAPEPEAAPEPAPEPEAAPEPEPEAAPEPEPEAAPEPAPESEPAPQVEEAPAEEEVQPQQEEAPAETAPETQEAPAEAQQQDAPAATEQQPDATEAPVAETPSTEAPASEAPAETQDGTTEAPADQPADATGEAPAQPDAAAPAEGAVDDTAPEGAAPQDGAATQPGEQPAQQAAPGELPPAPTTPEEVERARAIAQDPSQAPEGQPVILPVENGAAVLDSQKESVTTTTTTTTTTTDAPAGAAPGQTPAQAQPAAPVAAPTSDAEAQAPLQERGRVELRAATAEQGERIDGRPEFRRYDGWDYRDGDRRRDRDRSDRRDRRDRDDDDTRVIISIDNRTIVRHDDSSRFYRDGGEVYYERLPGERYREVVDRDGGVQVVTIRNSYGTVVQRSRIVDGEEYVLYYAPELYEEEEYVWRDPAADLPPMRLTVPLDEYIIDTSSDPDRDYYEFLEQPPVERVERVYSLDEVRYSARIRDKARRIDLDTVKFATGSAEIPMNQASSLKKVADAMNKILQDNPAETFMIEGHTDAVGSDDSNLILSDERAESVAVVLTDAFGIPPENLTTQGYGERFLKVRTEAANQENRRVTIRRITPLVKPVASNQ